MNLSKKEIIKEEQNTINDKTPIHTAHAHKSGNTFPSEGCSVNDASIIMYSIEIHDAYLTPDISVCSTGHYAKRFGGGYALNKDPVIGFSDNISRPGPNMCNLNAVLLGVSANERCVKVGDTLDDIREGKRAGMWTIALAGTGNEMYLLEEHEGKTEKEVEAIDPVGYQKKILKAYQNMAKEEPSFIVKSIREVPPALEQIESMIRRGYIPKIVKTQYLY